MPKLDSWSNDFKTGKGHLKKRFQAWVVQWENVGVNSTKCHWSMVCCFGQRGNCQHLQLCVPRVLRNEVLEFTHDIPSAGHLASRRLKEVLKKRLYWPNWKTNFKLHCKNCRKCVERNDSPMKSRSPLIVEQSGYFMERVAIEIIGSLSNTLTGIVIY